MDHPLFDAVAAFLDARLDDERANPTGRYASRAEAFKDLQAIRHLAEVYDTHPDYRHHWRPEGEEDPL